MATITLVCPSDCVTEALSHTVELLGRSDAALMKLLLGGRDVDIKYTHMVSDEENIQAAYCDAIKKVYATLFDKYAEAGGDPALEREADHQFTIGIGLARKTR